ncbi:MAG TPA: M48 family metallopeptidase [Phycisphaerales bacterium]
MGRLMVRLAFVGVAAASMGLGACSTNPTTGRSQLNLLSRDDEVRLGTDARPQMLQEYGGEVKNAELRNYVIEIGKKLAAQTEADNPSLPWEFALLDSDVINAFAIPGGKVFVSRGLAAKMTNEAQMAGVLGHEIGHVTARHINEKMTRTTFANAGLGIIGAAIGGGGDAVTGLAGQAVQLSLLSYDRGQESEADELGMRYMTKVGYNPAGQLQVMQILKAAAGSGKQPEFLSTHPLPDTRIKRIQELLATKYKDTQNNPAFKTGEAEFKARFLSKLAAIEQQERLADAGIGRVVPPEFNPFPYLPDMRMTAVVCVPSCDH